MSYRCVTEIKEIQQYLINAPVVAFDFETSPDEPYRNEERAALDAHKSHIVGVSFSVAEGSAIYVPFAHLSGDNASDQENIWNWLTMELFQNPTVVKVAHASGTDQAASRVFLYLCLL